MSRKPASLGTFIASKVNAAPSPYSALPTATDEVDDAAPTPVRRGPKPKPKTEPMVPINLMVPKSFRTELKKYAANQETTVTDIIREGIELYRTKHKAKT